MSTRLVDPDEFDDGGSKANEVIEREDGETEDGETEGRYRVMIEGHEDEMTYSRAGARLIIIDHSFAKLRAPWRNALKAAGGFFLLG